MCERERARERKRESTVCVWERETHFSVLMFSFCCVCCTLWCLDDRGRGLPYKAPWLPHSSSDAVFSVVGLNKTKTRNGLALERTLSIMAVLYVGVLCPSSGIKMCNKYLQLKKRNVGWNVYSLSLSHTHVGFYQRWKVTNYIYSRYCNWVAFLCTCTFLSNIFNL